MLQSAEVLAGRHAPEPVSSFRSLASVTSRQEAFYRPIVALVHGKRTMVSNSPAYLIVEPGGLKRHGMDGEATAW